MLKYHLPHNRNAGEIMCFRQMMWENGGGRRLGNYLAKKKKKGIKNYWDKQNLKVKQNWWISVWQIILLNICLIVLNKRLWSWVNRNA